MSTETKPKKFKRRVEVAVDSINFAKWDVSIPPNCSAITNGGVVISNNNPTQWAKVSVFTPRGQQLFTDIKQIEINERINELINKQSKDLKNE